MITRRLVALGALTAVAVTAHTLYNLRVTRRLTPKVVSVKESISILIPARDEADRLAPTLQHVMAQQGLEDFEICVLDDGSTDATAQIVLDHAQIEPRIRLLEGGSAPVPHGWLGKPWACHRLAQQARGSVLVFIDADVQLHPQAIATTVTAMRTSHLDLLSPYPRQLAYGLLERLTQPLVVWLWLSHLPVKLAETRPYPSLAAANGQFVAVDARAYQVSGGHASVANDVIEDVALLRSFKRHGYRGTPADGSAISQCRMYDGAEQVYRGYTKSLWSAFGSELGAFAVITALLITYVLPPLYLITGKSRSTRVWGFIGYTAAVTSRIVIARQTRERMWPDAFAQPLSILTLCGLTIASLVAHRRGKLSWRGRALTP